MRLGASIAAVGEIVGAFGFSNGVETAEGGVADSVAGSLCGVTLPVFELGK